MDVSESSKGKKEIKVEVKMDRTGVYNVVDKCIVPFNFLFNSHLNTTPRFTPNKI